MTGVQTCALPISSRRTSSSFCRRSPTGTRNKRPASPVGRDPGAVLQHGTKQNAPPLRRKEQGVSQSVTRKRASVSAHQALSLLLPASQVGRHPLVVVGRHRRELQLFLLGVFLITGITSLAYLFIYSLITFYLVSIEEEKELEKRIGAKYTDYKGRTGRFLPKLGRKMKKRNTASKKKTHVKKKRKP